MLGARLAEEVLLIDFDLHYGSLMLALDLEAIDALREALDQPDRIDALFIQQVAQKKNEYLYAMGAEEAPSGGFQARPHAAGDFLRSVHRRFRWIVADVPRGDPVIQRQVIEASTDILLITDLSLPGVRDAMRLQQLVQEVAPNAQLRIATSGAIDARRSAVKVADVERTLKRKVDCQIPADSGAALAAVNFGKPLSEAAPNSGIVKALRPLVASLDAPGGGGSNVKKATSLFARFGQGRKQEEEVGGDVRSAQQEARRDVGADGRSSRSYRPTQCRRNAPGCAAHARRSGGPCRGRGRRPARGRGAASARNGEGGRAGRRDHPPGRPAGPGSLPQQRCAAGAARASRLRRRRVAAGPAGDQLQHPGGFRKRNRGHGGARGCRSRRERADA